MSNPANYSPYNKTYKFILFQNQAYHERNKRNVSPCVRTNLRHSLSRYSPKKNPEVDFEKVSNSTKRCQSPVSHITRSQLFHSHHEIQNPVIDKPKLVVHRNYSYQKFKSRRIQQQNIQMATRILNTDCMVLKKDYTGRAFQNHKRYEYIRRRYDENGNRKDTVPLGQANLLCPTLMEFTNSGLASKFMELDLSMSVKPSTARSSMRKSCNSQFEN